MPSIVQAVDEDGPCAEYFARGAAQVSKRTHVPASETRAVLTRAGGICECGCAQPMQKIEIHHVLPVEYGGSNSQENLKAVSYECHKRMTRSFITAHSKITRIEKAANQPGDLIERIDAMLAAKKRGWYELRALLMNCRDELRAHREKEVA
jgi:hypothetical protein